MGQNHDFLSCGTSVPQSSALSKLCQSRLQLQCFIPWEYCHFPADSDPVNTLFGFTYAVVKLLVLNMYKYILINEYTFLE